MTYNYFAKIEQYKYLSGGVKAWDLLLPNNIGLKKGDTVRVWEVTNEEDSTGRVTDGTIVFNGVDGIMTVNGNRDFYYINNLNSYTMYKIFKATINQSGTAIPTATILENTTGLTPTFSRDDVGVYGIDNLGITNPAKVIVLISSTNDSQTQQLAVAMQTGHEILLQSFLGIANPCDEIMVQAGIEVLIYQ